MYSERTYTHKQVTLRSRNVGILQRHLCSPYASLKRFYFESFFSVFKNWENEVHMRSALHKQLPYKGQIVCAYTEPIYDVHIEKKVSHRFVLQQKKKA